MVRRRVNPPKTVKAFGDLIHMDNVYMVDKSGIAGIGGKKDGACFIDEFSKYRAIYPARSKVSDVTSLAIRTFVGPYQTVGVV